jgi:hypothetical protein
MLPLSRVWGIFYLLQSSSLGLGEGLTTPDHKRPAVIKCYTGTLKWALMNTHSNEPLGSIKGREFD